MRGDPTFAVVPRAQDYGGQVAPSPPLATSDKLVIGLARWEGSRFVLPVGRARLPKNLLFSAGKNVSLGDSISYA